MNPSAATGNPQPLHLSPDRSKVPQAIHARIATALENALPGVNSGELVHSLDTLLGGRSNYTIVGSTSMHLHALEHPNATCILPMPNDLDVVVNDTAIRRVDLANTEALSKLNLKRDPHLAHVLYLKRETAPDLKIDMVHSNTPGFLKYQFNPHSTYGLQIGMLADSLADYKARRTDQEYIQQCGGQIEANAKVQPWIDYFDQFGHLAATSLPRDIAKRRPTRSPGSDENSDGPLKSGHVARILKFGN